MTVPFGIPLTINRSEILDVIDAELNEAAEPHRFKVVAHQNAHGRRCSLKVEPVDDHAVLDERLENCFVTWQGPPASGVANVLAALPTENALHLWRISGGPRAQHQLIRVREPAYLVGLRVLWESDAWVHSACSWLQRAQEAAPIGTAIVPPPGLRSAQHEAFRLPAYRLSFLWGPPGTGKTYTLGALVSSLLLNSLTARVLVLANANTAVDHAILAIDDALRDVPEPRPACLRSE